jgi:hypothetical protein
MVGKRRERDRPVQPAMVWQQGLTGVCNMLANGRIKETPVRRAGRRQPALAGRIAPALRPRPAAAGAGAAIRGLHKGLRPFT